MSVADYIHDPHAEIARLRRIIASKDEEIERLTQKLKIEKATDFLPPRAWRLTGTEQAMLEQLCTRSICSRELLFEAMRAYGKSFPDTGLKVVDVKLVHLRQKLKPMGVSIHSEFGRGWFIEREQRQKIIAACNEADR